MSRLCLARKCGESLIFTVFNETIKVSFDAIRRGKIQISIVASHEVAITRSSSTQIGEQEEGIPCPKN